MSPILFSNPLCIALQVAQQVFILIANYPPFYFLGLLKAEK